MICLLNHPYELSLIRLAGLDAQAIEWLNGQLVCYCGQPDGSVRVVVIPVGDKEFS